MIENIEQILTGIRKVLEAEMKPEPVVSKYPDNLMDGWGVGICGTITKIVNLVCNKTFAQQIFDAGNWFATKEEAELEVKRRAVIQKTRAYGFVPDWSDRQEYKYAITFDRCEDDFDVAYDTYDQGVSLFEVYFETEEKRQACLDALGDEILEVL